MIKVLSFTSIILFSSIAIADYSGQYDTRVTTTHMVGNTAPSKDAAVAEGRSMLEEINSKSAYELSKNVPFTNHDIIDNRSYEVLASEIIIEEVVTKGGNVAYKPVLNVKYSYYYRDHHNRN